MAAMRTQPIPQDAPEQSYPLLRRVLPKRMQPFLRGLRKRLKREGYRPDMPFSAIYAHTQLSAARQDSIYEKTTALVRDGVTGAFVECGVLDGGTSALMGYVARNDADRKLHLFDAWEGLPATTPEDGRGGERWVGEVVGSPRRVERILRKVGTRMENVVVHRGWFDDTIPTAETGPIAFLHVDCDFYKPTLLVLRTLVPRVVSGGWVQIDDYLSFEGSRLAVNEYLADRDDIELVVPGHPGGAIYFRMP